MNAETMLRAAREIVAPIGATKAIATYDQGAYRAAFLIDNRRHSAPVGPGFAKPREVVRFVDILNGDDPAPRPGSDDLAGRWGLTSRDARIQPEAPDDEAAPGTPGTEPATTPDPAQQAVVDASLPGPAAIPPAAGARTSPRPAAPA